MMYLRVWPSHLILTKKYSRRGQSNLCHLNEFLYLPKELGKCVCNKGRKRRTLEGLLLCLEEVSVSSENLMP